MKLTLFGINVVQCLLTDYQSLSDDLFIEAQNDTVDKYLKVFKYVFILTKHKGHYDMMMGIENSA